MGEHETTSFVVVPTNLRYLPIAAIPSPAESAGCGAAGACAVVGVGPQPRFLACQGWRSDSGGRNSLPRSNQHPEAGSHGVEIRNNVDSREARDPGRGGDDE